ncbi:hypothetical protein CYMTET_14809 [Cymbomonas tetramitiformis]|uniref:Uncharacterized protein n=1 Tax=Cymbomonas tetramitiformis TaxID=36881 RepID=A0AAE0GFT5_9CHLO|nr:hypothetical protein CYMTET_14809 [Cymbomonas tetramitiformis]
MFISVRSPGGKLVTLVVAENATALDVLHSEHLAEWPVPNFDEYTPVVVKRAKSGERIFLPAEMCADHPLSNLHAMMPGSLLQISWSMDGNIHIWVTYPKKGETYVLGKDCDPTVGVGTTDWHSLERPSGPPARLDRGL